MDENSSIGPFPHGVRCFPGPGEIGSYALRGAVERIRSPINDHPQDISPRAEEPRLGDVHENTFSFRVAHRLQIGWLDVKMICYQGSFYNLDSVGW